MFFEAADYQYYKDLVFAAALKASCEIWSYCLMPNHVHFIVVPSDKDGLRKMFADAHRRYTGFVNARMKVTGHLWQGRYSSVVMDEPHLFHAFRYIALNPVRARLVKQEDDWEWSSVRDHLIGNDDRAFKAQPALERVGAFGKFLDADFDDEAVFERIRSHETIGRPLGNKQWLRELEQKLERPILPQKRGRKTKDKSKPSP